MKKLLPIIGLIALLGQGCPTPTATPPTAPQGGESDVSAPATKLGFGKLPALQAIPVASPSAGIMQVTAPSATARVGEAGVMMAQADAMMAAPGSVGAGVVEGRPIPMPPQPFKPVTIKYNITADLPTWGGEDQVFRVKNQEIDSGIIRSLAVPAGLPSTLAGQIKQVQSVNMTWMDGEDYQWSYEPTYGNLNWWKQNYDIRPMMAVSAEIAPGGIRPTPAPTSVDRARAIAAADAFLNAHGLENIREQGGSIEDQPWMTATDLAMPCIMKDDVMAQEAEVAGVSASGEATSLIYPSPCGWYPQEATVFYGSSLEGRSVVDAGGWPFRLSSVQVSLSDYSVRGGNVQMMQSLDRSAYPLITREEAMKRLEAGGRNPIYGWDGGGDISVEITNVELAWMRFDSWIGNKQESYFLPALAAKGTVDRNLPGQEPEVYNTVVLLVADEAFDLGDNGGVPMPVEPFMMDVPAVMPVSEPKR